MAVEWQSALAQMARAGVDPGDVSTLVEEWMRGSRAVWLRPAADPATGGVSLVIWGRTSYGKPLAVYACKVGRDLEIFSATYLTDEQTSELEQWESDNRDQ